MKLILETVRLQLFEVELGDAQFIFGLMNSPGWLEFIGDRGIKTRVDAEQYIKKRFIKSYKDNGYGLYKMVLKDSAQPIGLCGLVSRPGLKDPDIGFAILPSSERKGYTYEASIAILNHSFAALSLQKILAITSLDNYASQQLLIKIGLRKHGRVRLDEDKEEELLLFVIEKKE